MLKTIEKSSVNRRSFPVHKKWTITDSQYQIVSASIEAGAFDADSFTKQDGIITHSLYKSIKSQFYNQNVDAYTLFGSISDIANIAKERNISDTVYVIDIPQDKFGEKVKPGTLELRDIDNSLTFTDDSKGNIVTDIPLYTLLLLDLQSGVLQLEDADGDTFTGTLSDLDLNTGIGTMTFGSDTDSVEVVKIDFENGTLQTAIPLDFDGLTIDVFRYGNIFYSSGLVVLANLSAPIKNYSMDFRSTKTIHETEVLITAKAGEFNYSQNPSAVDVTLSGSYDFTTTAIPNVSPAHTKKIKEVRDIKRKESFSGSYGSVTGSWDDYYTNQSTDPTGSYLAPFVSTIGLYDESGDMVAIAKLPKPIKNLPDYDLNFIVRFDT